MQEQNQSALAIVPGSNHGVFANAELFVHAQRVAQCLVESTMVPDYYRGKGNIGNAVIAIDIAWRLQLPPLMVMQHLYVVYGKPAWSGQMVIALINNSGLFPEPLEFEFKGEKGKDDWGCRAVAISGKTGKPINGPWVDIALAKAEGWYGKKDSKWQSMPEMMLRYRAGAFFGRTVCPNVTIGLRLVEEEQELPSGPTIDLPTGAEKPDFGAALAAAAPTAPAATPAADAPAPRMKRVKTSPMPPAPAQAPAAPAEPTPPANEQPADVPPAAANPPAPVADPKPAQPAQPEPTPPTAQASTPEASVEELATLLESKLNAANVTADNFFDWLGASGRGQMFKFDPADIENATQLPRALLVALTAENSSDLKACIRVHGGKP